MKKINLASGQRPFPKPWVNIDIRDQGYDVDILADAKELPFEDNSVDIIVAHHLWEHIPLHEQESYSREWWRVLKKGGILAVFVPNMRILAKAWVDGKIDTFTFCVNSHGAWQGHVTDLHRWSYDEMELKDRLRVWDGKECKFDFKTRAVGKSNPLYRGSDIAHDWWILGMEFVK